MANVARPQIHFSYIDLQKNEARNLVLQNLGADIATPVDGLIYYKTDTDKARLRANGVWVDLATMADVTAGGISSAIIDAKGDLIVGSAADTAIRLGVGANGTGLYANSAQAGGMEWRLGVAADHSFASTDRLLGRDTAAAGPGEEITVGGGIEFTGSGGIQTSAFTGNVTKAAGGTVLTIAAGVVTLAMQAPLAANSIVGNNTGSSATPIALTYAQVKTALAYTAAEITFSPTGGISSGTVQAAIAELETDLLASITAATEGKAWKDPVKAASTANLTLTGPGATIDGVTMVAGDRFLAKDQTSHQQDGIYIWNGAASTATRAPDMSTAAESNNATVLVEDGTVNKGDTYTQTATIATLDTTPMVWAKSGEGNTVYGADGTTITLTGATFSVTTGGITATQLATSVAGNGLAGGGGTALSVNVDAANMEISGDAVRISAAAAGAGLSGGGAAALAVGQGTGILVAADTVGIDTAVVVRKYAVAIGNGALTSFTITHNLNTRDITVAVYEATTFEVWEVDVAYTTVNTCTVTFTGSVPTTNQFRVVVQA